jgi:hypothetical protein
MMFPKVGAGPMLGRAGLEGCEPRIHEVQPPLVVSDLDVGTRFMVEVEFNGVRVGKGEGDDVDEGRRESGS